MLRRNESGRVDQHSFKRAKDFKGCGIFLASYACLADS